MRIKNILIFLLSLSFVLVGSCGASACNDNRFSLGEVKVYVDSSYRNEYEEKKITEKDFNWNNIKEVKYQGWDETKNAGVLIVYLKRNKQKYIQSAIQHFDTLPFVKSTEEIFIMTIYD